MISAAAARVATWVLRIGRAHRMPSVVSAAAQYTSVKQPGCVKPRLERHVASAAGVAAKQRRTAMRRLAVRILIPGDHLVWAHAADRMSSRRISRPQIRPSRRW